MVAHSNPLVNALRSRAESDPDRFWAEEAGKLHWFQPWSRVFETDPPEFKWFSGGRTNLCYNCLDRHVESGRGGHAALIYENERGERRVFTYHELWMHVKRVAAALRGLGVRRGDRVAIYMPTMPEAIMAMLACARIGAIHLVVFAGFGSGALAERIRLRRDEGPADGGHHVPEGKGYLAARDCGNRSPRARHTRGEGRDPAPRKQGPIVAPGSRSPLERVRGPLKGAVGRLRIDGGE